jgi:hypothetical protein
MLGPWACKSRWERSSRPSCKWGAALEPPVPPIYSFASLKCQAKAAATSGLQRHWQAVTPQSYQDLWIHSSPRCPAELRLPRYLLGRILAARTGHGNLLTAMSGSIMKTHIYIAGVEPGSLQLTSSSAEWLRDASPDPQSPPQRQFPS